VGKRQPELGLFNYSARRRQQLAICIVESAGQSASVTCWLPLSPSHAGSSSSRTTSPSSGGWPGWSWRTGL